jgi:hypothetical protein
MTLIKFLAENPFYSVEEYLDGNKMKVGLMDRQLKCKEINGKKNA